MNRGNLAEDPKAGLSSSSRYSREGGEKNSLLYVDSSKLKLLNPLIIRADLSGVILLMKQFYLALSLEGIGLSVQIKERRKVLSQIRVVFMK